MEKWKGKESNRTSRRGPRLRVSWDCGVGDWPRGPGPKGDLAERDERSLQRSIVDHYKDLSFAELVGGLEGS